MFRALIAVFFFVSSAFSLIAEDLDYAAGDALRDAALRGEIDTVETMLRNAQTLYEAGEIPADQVRILNTPFSYTHPDMVRFIEKWRTELPASPYAKIAEVWLLHQTSGYIRGENSVRRTYPEALQRFAFMQDTAWDMAAEVYRAHPRMIPASDALLRLGNGSGNKRAALHAFRATMKDDPNTGTLRRFMDMMYPGWGWKWRHVEAACDQYASLVNDPDPQPELSCRLRKARGFNVEKRAWMHDRLAKGDLPHLDHLRLSTMINEGETLAEAERARELILDGFGTVDDIALFDLRFAWNFKLEPLTEKISRNRREAALARYEYDPFNLSVLDALLKPVVRTDINAFGLGKTTVLERPSNEEVIEYRRKKLIAAPFNASAWEDYLQARANAEDPLNLSEFKAFHINAIVYSNYDPAAIDIYLVRLVGVYRRIQAFERGNAGHLLQSYYKDVDPDSEVLCPFLRAYSVYRLSCRAWTSVQCHDNSMVEATYADLEDDASRRGICLKERNTPAQDMLFDPFSSSDLKSLQSGG